MAVSVNTELRKLRPGELYTLGVILTPSDNWKKLMTSVTEGANDILKFPGEYVSVIEEGARQERKLAALVFLEEWATMGKKRPTVGLLLDLVTKMQFFRAADYLSQNILKVAAPKRPASGPAATVDVDAICDLMLQYNLDTISASIDSNDHSTCEIGACGNNNLAVDDDVRCIDIRYAELESNASVGAAEIIAVSPKPSKNNTELVKLNATRSQHSQEYSQPEMLKFESEKVARNEVIELNEAAIPNSNISRQNFSTTDDSNWLTNYGIPSRGEVPSAELPACLGGFSDSDESRAAGDSRAATNSCNKHFNRESIGISLFVGNGKAGVCLRERTGSDGSSILSYESLNRSVESRDTEDGVSVVEISSVSSEELPIPVLEFRNR